MINFYEPSIIEKRKQELKKFRVLFYVVLAIAIATIVALCFIIGYKNKKIVQPTMIGISMIFAALLVFIYCYLLYPNKWVINRVSLINRSFKHEVSGVVKSIKESATLRRDIIGKEIVFEIDGVDTVLYLEDNEIQFEFVLGQKYNLSTFDNFIVLAEEAKDE